jgi:hypothetical protein
MQVSVQYVTVTAYTRKTFTLQQATKVQRGVDVQLYSFFKLSARWELGGQRHAQVALPPGKTRYPLHSGLGEPQGRSGRVQKMSYIPGFDPGPSRP